MARGAQAGEGGEGLGMRGDSTRGVGGCFSSRAAPQALYMDDAGPWRGGLLDGLRPEQRRRDGLLSAMYVKSSRAGANSGIHGRGGRERRGEPLDRVSCLGW